MLQIDAIAGTHAGLVRDSNEDSGYAGASLVLVADGVGGAHAGEVASATATLVAARLAARWGGTDPTAVLDAVVREAQTAIRQHVSEHPDHVGLATTLTAVHTDGARCALVHVGDSRAYVLRRGKLSQVTQDHTLVNEMVAAGTITRDQAATSPYRHHILRSLSADDVTPDIGRVELQVGDRVLLCTDGLTDGVDDAAIARLLATGTPEDALEALISAALAAGGHDNVTCVVGDVVDRPLRASGGHVVGSALDVTRPAAATS